MSAGETTSNWAASRCVGTTQPSRPGAAAATTASAISARVSRWGPPRLYTPACDTGQLAMSSCRQATTSATSTAQRYSLSKASILGSVFSSAESANCKKVCFLQFPRAFGPRTSEQRSEMAAAPRRDSTTRSNRSLDRPYSFTGTAGMSSAYRRSAVARPAYTWSDEKLMRRAAGACVTMASSRHVGSLTLAHVAGSRSQASGAEMAARCTTTSGRIVRTSSATAAASQRSSGETEAQSAPNSRAKATSEP
mmetsp:Transcript_46734/g.109082  ORF Transcript_46734/g.109082 Transcript_46734/m.109082 type:complete len:251 (-) Transcript_46734:158-910(-)